MTSSPIAATGTTVTLAWQLAHNFSDMPLQSHKSTGTACVLDNGQQSTTANSAARGGYVTAMIKTGDSLSDATAGAALKLLLEITTDAAEAFEEVRTALDQPNV